MERDASMVGLLNLLDPDSLVDKAPGQRPEAPEPPMARQTSAFEQHSALSRRGVALVGGISACCWYVMRLVLRDFLSRGGQGDRQRRFVLELHALSTCHALGWLIFLVQKLRRPMEELPQYCSRALVASLGFYLHDCWALRGTLLDGPTMLLHQASVAATIASILRSKGVAWLAPPFMSLSVPTLVQELLLLCGTAGVPATRPEVRGLRLLWFASFIASKLALVPLWLKYHDCPELHQPALLSGKVSYLFGLCLNLYFMASAARDLPRYLRIKGAAVPAIAEAYQVPLKTMRVTGTVVVAGAMLSAVFGSYLAAPTAAALAVLACVRPGSSLPLRLVAGALCTTVAVDQLLPMPQECAPAVRHFMPLLRTVKTAFNHRFYPDSKLELRRDRSYLLVVTPHGFFPWGVAAIIIELLEQGYLPNFMGASVLGALPIAGRLLRCFGYCPATRENTRRCLQKPYPRNVTIIIPGGIHEMFLSRPDIEISAAASRTGFAEIAVESKAMLLPGYMFGSSQLYKIAQGWIGRFFEGLSRWLRTSITPFHGRWGTLLPYPHPLACALGAPIDAAETNDAGQVHRLWCERLRSAYEEHREAFGWPGRRLFFDGEGALPRQPEDPLASYSPLLSRM